MLQSTEGFIYTNCAGSQIAVALFQDTEKIYHKWNMIFKIYLLIIDPETAMLLIVLNTTLEHSSSSCVIMLSKFKNYNCARNPLFDIR